MKHSYSLKIKIFISLISLFVGTANAHDFAVKNSDGKYIYYNVISSTGEKKAGVTQRSYNAYGAYEGVINIPETVTYQGTEYAVTEILSSAFRTSRYLTEVNIPNTITRIGTLAFSECDSLEKVTIPESVKYILSNAFSKSQSLKNINIPNSVVNIGSGIFSGCTSLTDVCLSNSIKIIGDNAFKNCTSLETIVIPDSVTEIGVSAFDGC